MFEFFLCCTFSFIQIKRPVELSDDEVLDLLINLKEYAKQFEFIEDEEKIQNWRIDSNRWQEYMKNSPREYSEEIIYLLDFLIRSAYGDEK